MRIWKPERIPLFEKYLFTQALNRGCSGILDDEVYSCHQTLTHVYFNVSSS